MKQRDQNQRGNEQRHGGRYGSMAQAGRDYDEGRSRQSRGGGARFTDTYNPEPQWLREQGSERQYGQPLASGGYDRDDEDYRGGGYANASREYGGRQERQYGSRHGAEDQEREFAQQGHAQQQDRQYGRQYNQSSYGGYGRGQQEPYESQYRQDSYRGGSARSQGRWERDEQEYAAGAGFGRGEQAYGQGGYSGSRYGMQSGARQERQGSQFMSDYGGGGYDQVSGYGSRDFGGSGYGSSRTGSFGTGNYQSGMEGQRSYRGLGPQSYKRSDDRIRDDVCERLTDNDRIDASNVTIDVNQGAVTLSGTVPERNMRYAAEDLVDDCMGVESINNQLRVQDRGTGASTGSQATTGVGGRAGSASAEKQTH